MPLASTAAKTLSLLTAVTIALTATDQSATAAPRQTAAHSAASMSRPVIGVYRWQPVPLHWQLVLLRGLHVPVPPPTPAPVTHPNVLPAINTLRAARGWAPARAGSNTAAENCVLHQQCFGVQWGGCGLSPQPGDEGLQTVGSAEVTDRRGCVEAISYSDWN